MTEFRYIVPPDRDALIEFANQSERLSGSHQAETHLAVMDQLLSLDSLRDGVSPRVFRVWTVSEDQYDRLTHLLVRFDSLWKVQREHSELQDWIPIVSGMLRELAAEGFDLRILRAYLAWVSAAHRWAIPIFSTQTHQDQEFLSAIQDPSSAPDAEIRRRLALSQKLRERVLDLYGRLCFRKNHQETSSTYQPRPTDGQGIWIVEWHALLAAEDAWRRGELGAISR